MEILSKYLESHAGRLNSMMTAYCAQLDSIKSVSPSVARSIVSEICNQRTHLKLIASENYSSAAVQAAMGTLLTDKYAEGFPFHRFYAGCENVDDIESRACELACSVFGAQHAYVQPHSGADANLCAYWAIINQRVQIPSLEKIECKNVSELSREQWNEIRKLTGNQRLLGLDYSCGGHLTHGYRQNVSAQMFDAYSYGVDKETGLLDYDTVRKIAMEVKPLILLAGYSAYPRKINFRIMRDIASSCGAVLMVDMAHFAGLVAGKVFTGDYNPVLWADVVTTTTHKTLRGPRGGMILCTKEFADSVDKGCPLVMGGPLPHVMAAKAVALEEASRPEFADYASRIVKNSRAMADRLAELGAGIQTGGTDNHLFLVDVTSFGLNGRQAENLLISCGITINRNALPYDKNGPWYTSGLRIGTAAVTTLGMDESDMREIADIIFSVLSAAKPETKAKAVTESHVQTTARLRVQTLLEKHLLYPDLDLQWLQQNV